MITVDQQQQLLLLVLLLIFNVSCLHALYFEDGFDHHYTYSSQSDILGLHNVTTIIKFRVRSVNETAGRQSLNLLMVDSFVQHSEQGYVVDNPLQWQFNHKFFFTVGSDGQVTFVHFNPEEKDEVLTLKKVLASTLSLKVKIDNGNSWKFTSHEEDHAGHMEHEYEASRHTDGITFVRKHQSSKDVHRLHYKTVHLDSLGTPVHVEAIDNITLRHTPTQVSSQPKDGFADIEDKHYGDFPKISSISRSHVKMTSKRRHDDVTYHSVNNLKKDSLSVKQKPPVKVPLSKVEDEIKRYLTCVHSIENKYDRNRTECIHNLRTLVYSLEKHDFVKLGTEALTRQCEPYDVLCKEERNLFIDIVTREGTAEAQFMVLELVMRNPNVTEEDLRRCLFHSIALSFPELELVRHIEQLCFEKDVDPGDTPALSKTQKRACLSLGAMAKSLHAKNVTESDRIVEKIENWLDHHNETKSMDIVKPRERRSIIQNDIPAQKHIETKMVLLQSLGNAGKQRSLKHIRSYMEPNAGVTAWRRAAIHSLRHFSCNESAHALLTSAVHDDDDVVRQTAVKVLKKHPKSENFTVEHENIVLSKNYSYPVVSRVRRGLLQTLEQGISVVINPPGIEWDKTIGTGNIGASFGLHIRNILDLKLALLSGHFMIDVFDEAYAEAHVGMINFKEEIIKAHICFKGRIKYDLNVLKIYVSKCLSYEKYELDASTEYFSVEKAPQDLKDFAINSLSDLVKIYDKIVGKIVTPITKVIDNFRDIVTYFKEGGLGKIVNAIVQTVKNLPTILGEVAQRMKEFVDEVFSIAGSTIMEEIKIIIAYVRNFIDDVKQNILKFYNDIVDAVTMALPYISKKIVDAFSLIVNAFGRILNNPLQAITSMSMGVTSIKTAVTMAVDVKTKVVDSCMFIKGRAMEWMNTAKEIPNIIKRLGDLLKRLVQSVSSRTRRDVESNMTNVLSDGINGMKTSLHSLESDLMAKWESVLAPLRPLTDIVAPFMEAFKNVMEIIKGVKIAYHEMKKTIETSKSLVQKVFGPKFHANFPTDRRPAKGNCTEGVWPTANMSDDRYETTGIDIELGVRQSIPMPVNGIVHIKDGGKVVIQPTDPEFAVLEIVIENIEPDDKYSEKSVKAGKTIGRAGKAPKCDPNSIHVSVRKTQEKEVPDADYDYTDPGPFLDRLVPVPKWIRECKDFEFRYIGQTFDSGDLTEDEDLKAEKESIKREPGTSEKDLENMLGKEEPTYTPAHDSFYDPNSFKDSLKQSLAENAKKFVEFFKTALFGKDGPKVPNILEIVDINRYNVDWLLGKLELGSQVDKDFRDLLDKLSAKMTSLPEGNPATMSLTFIKNVLNLNDLKLSVSGGDASNVADKLMTMAGKVCPTFQNAVATGFGHVCTVHKCCLGITCSVPIPFGAKKKYLSVGVAVHPENASIVASIMDRIFEFSADEIDKEYELEFKPFKMNLSLVVNGKIVNSTVVITAELKLCTGRFLGCLPPIDLFHEIKFDLSNCRDKRSAISATTQEITLHSLSIPKFIAQLGEYQLLNKDVIRVLDNVRKTVVNELMSEAAEKLGDIVKEFKDKIDFCITANIPVPPIPIPIFHLEQLFMAGPVPLTLEFGAAGTVGLDVKVGLCVLSMTSKLTLTPSVGGMVWGDASVNIIFARGGISLTGWLLETKFPMTTELVFSKYPIDVGSKMDLVLTPLRLELKAYAKLNLFFTQVTVFDSILWQYAVPTIQKNIFNKRKTDNDPSPPDVMPVTINKRQKRSGVAGCIVKQIAGRPNYDPAFSLEMYAQDEVSDVKLFYAIGTHRGGTNVVDWTDMGGNSLMLPCKLPGGVPLYWSVKAKNSQGLEAISQCWLDTYDNTLPDGRVEHSYTFSSHPHKIIASVVAFEDSPLVEVHYKAVGFSPGQFGSQFVDWEVLRLDHSATREGVSGALKHFTIPREGKLVAWILKSQKTSTPEICAQRCMDYGSNCISFDYEHHSETCDFHDVVQGANAYLRISGTYSNYERLGSGYHTPLEYDNLDLLHGSTYYVNTRVRNVLGYDAYLFGEGTMVDFTPPKPGIINNAKSDKLRADNCTAAITQQCIDVTWKENHRIIIDGPDSGTVFNGHEPLHDELYTLTNHFVSANWKGFHDDESGIYGYTWAVGTDVCGTNVIPYRDPYAHLTNKKFWTDSGFQKGVHLEDGRYYVTVQALNGAELGGSLVTTVCHSTPFTVDTTPPVFHGVTDIIYDEDFDLIAIYYNATDDLSKIKDAEFGLGKTKYDVKLKPYSLHASMDRNDPFVAVEDLGLQEGVPAWIRIRVTNNVELFTAGHGDEPILIDKSPPIAGRVLDGDRLQRDSAFQSEDYKICAQWVDFFDPESGIDRFLWGVGRKAGTDDVVKFHNLTRYDKSSCADVKLQHNNMYFSTVFAYNNALNSKSTNSSSDGVLVDITLPIAGKVMDGKSGTPDLSFSSETVSKFANWNGFYDPESGIDHYKVDVVINNEHKKTFDVGMESAFEDHTLSMEHKDEVKFKVYGVNGADLENATYSNGFMVDLTTPLLTAISDSKNDISYQSDNNALHLMWEFKDEESGIKEYRTVIYETRYGVKQKFWPQSSPHNISVPLSPTFTKMEVLLDGLSLADGSLYTLHVTALNRALLATSHETEGVTIDTTPPQAPKVHIGLWKDEEELDEHGNVLHDDQTAIRVSWSTRDPESGVKQFFVAVGTTTNEESVFKYFDFVDETSAYIQNINFETTQESKIYYMVSVKAINGAGLISDVGTSKPIFVQKANVPGIVFDGRNLFEDEAYTTDHSSIAASFYGFESESCSIISYDWAIGTHEYGTDIQTYTNYGLVLLNETHGQCQIHTELFEDTTYFITIRAVTGCQEQYIVSSSDGITLDRKPPEVLFEAANTNETSIVTVNGVIYQANTDSLALTSNVTDRNSVASVQFALGSLPLLGDRHPFTSDFSKLTSVLTLTPGETMFITTNTSDEAGNQNITSSLAIIADTTSPIIRNLECTQYLSARKSMLTCSWETVVEYESLVDRIVISLGSTSSEFDILDSYVVPKHFRSFTRDLHNHIGAKANMTSLYVNVLIKNVIGHSKTYGHEVVVDRTAPVAKRLDVITSVGLENITEHQKCQLPRGYAELRPHGLLDAESGIDTYRYEVSIGNKPYGTEILDYTSVTLNHDGVIFIDGFSLHDGATFYATLRIYNNAGLKTEVTSDSVVISQNPTLRVYDGDQENDVDYQSVPNLIQGRWEYSDLCPIKDASWSVSDLTGKILFDFQTIPSASKTFYNDEVALENGMKYIVTVKTVDFLGRPKTSRSDGVSVRIQPPLPGLVRDGLKEDLNYQYSISDLSANWDAFGDDSKDPTQSIHHYEVAIGNDRRYAKTRTNVHYFVNVGLNTSYTFENLNLTSKLIRYYITVRSYSMAGGYTEGYSNGIRVGYNDDIHAGSISVRKYQSSTTSVEASWTGFRSDIDIIDYMVGISSHQELATNDTLTCSMLMDNLTAYDIYQLNSVGLNEYYKVEGLKLQHRETFYVTLVAKDEAGMCTGITSEQVLVDTTPPTQGLLFINNIQSSTIVYSESSSELHVSWTNFLDMESTIALAKVTLFQCQSCNVYNVSANKNCFDVAENIVANDVKTSFYELQLDTEKVYYILLEFTNGAQLVNREQSVPVLVDTSSPFIGQVKISKDWYSLSNFQHSTSKLHGLLAIASSLDDYICPTQKHFFPSGIEPNFIQFSDDFSTDFVVVNSSGAYLGLGYNADLTEITKSSIMSSSFPLQRGNYSFTARAARGYNTITTLALLTDAMAVSFSINEKPTEEVFDYSRFDNMTGLEAPEQNNTENENATTTLPTTTVKQTGSFVSTNDTNEDKETNFETEAYGIGIHFLGYKIANNKNWHNVFWARNKFTSIERWFQLPFDPTNEDHKYTILVDKKSEYLETTLDLTLIVDNEEVINIAGFKFYGELKIAALTWNENGYKPPIKDVYHPFYIDAVVKTIDIPDENDRPCRHGRGFYDGESSIKYIELGISDSKKEIGNIVPLSTYKRFCYPCKTPCETLCKQPCSGEPLSQGFNLIQLDVSGLSLQSPNKNDICQNITNEHECNSTAYYLNVKVVNFAGKESVAYSNAVQVDLTPPQCEYVKCLDPAYSEDEPTEHIGSSSTIGAYWNCTEDISQIGSYTVRVLSSNKDVVLDNTDVGLKTKVKFELENGTFEDGEHYTVEVTAVNTAGMSFNKSCGVLVKLYPPDTTGASTMPLYIDAADSPSSVVEEDSPLWTSSQTNIGLEWQGGNADIEFYEWQIGTNKEGRDLLPPVKVGNKVTGSSAIVKGKLEFDRKSINRSVAEFRNTSNMTPEEIQNLTATSEQEKAFFYMEPGRCVHQSLYGIGYSHLKSKIQGKTICVKRNDDVFLNGTSLSGSSKRIVASNSKTSNKWTSSVVPDPRVVVDANLMAGGVSLGTLTKTDLDSDYGSAATADYKPFIVDPEFTSDRTSRLLRNRIQHLCNVTFYMSPSPLAEYERITINVTVPPECEKSPNFQPALMYWNIEKEQWVHIDEGCRDHLTAEMYAGVYTAEVCKARTIKTGKRDTTATLESPRMYAVANISRTFPNHPPSIITEILHFVEDKADELQIQTVDLENDILVYEIIEYPLNLDCVLANDTGKLSCTPEEDFYGINIIKIKVTETGLPQYEQPLVHQKQITLNVTAQPDKTDRYYIDANETIHFDKRPSMLRQLLAEANRSSSLFAGTVLFADVDGGEIFTVQESFTQLGNSTHSLTVADTSTIPIGNVSSRNYRSMDAYDINFKFSPLLNGNMSLKLIARTADNAYTPSVTVELYILENPCVYGHCSHVTRGVTGCDDIARSTSFLQYVCVCDPGYEGEWCQTETNECQTAPCALMFDCEDLINDFRCNINIPKLMAILVCSMIAIGGAVFLVYKLMGRLKLYRIKNKVAPSMAIIRDNYIRETYELRQTDAERPTTSGSIPLETAAPSTAPSSTQVWTNPNWNWDDVSDGEEEVGVTGVTSIITTAGKKLPPHHLKPKQKESASDTPIEGLPEKVKSNEAKLKRFNADSVHPFQAEIEEDAPKAQEMAVTGSQNVQI